MQARTRKRLQEEVLVDSIETLIDLLHSFIQSIMLCILFLSIYFILPRLRSLSPLLSPLYFPSHCFRYTP